MNEIVPNLWLGDLNNATDTDLLKSKNIHSILSVIRGHFSIAETFKRHQIQLDDTEEEDILKHLVTAITFIEAELDKDRGVLVHCLAGVSRSVTIVAAYLMYAKGIDPTTALELIRAARPIADPNSSFLNQLEVFYQASCKVSQHDKGVRKFYLDRLVKDISRDGTVDSDMLSSLPSISAPSTSNELRRRIRCKMCRTELASRDNMLDHGQMIPPSPSVSYSPTVPSIPIPARPRGLSEPNLPHSRLGEELNLTSKDVDEAVNLGRQLSESLSIEETNDAPNGPADENPSDATSVEIIKISEERIGASSTIPPDAPSPVIPPGRSPQAATSGLAHPSDLSAQLYANPKLAALRGINVVTQPSASPSASILTPSSPPILANAKCSGYFVEPLKWMEPFLEQGQLSGKIICPNKKCNAKLGNYDWAGVCCSCKEWVVPGFCIHRSKVDEVM